MKILHFAGKGKGFMSGITEYIVISDDDDIPVEDWIASGFELSSSTKLLQALPSSLPLNTTLIARQ